MVMYNDHMRSIPISQFKAHCLELVREVQRTGDSIILTNRGEPAAVVSPPSATKKPYQLGLFVGTAKVVGDIVSPRPEDWEMGD